MKVTRGNLRCKVSFDKDLNRFVLKVQSRVFIFWITRLYICVRDGFWGEDHPLSKGKISMRSINGVAIEAYKTGTLNLEKRANELLDEYLEGLDKQKKDA